MVAGHYFSCFRQLLHVPEPWQRSLRFRRYPSLNARIEGRSGSVRPVPIDPSTRSRCRCVAALRKAVTLDLGRNRQPCRWLGFGETRVLACGVSGLGAQPSKCVCTKLGAVRILRAENRAVPTNCESRHILNRKTARVCLLDAGIPCLLECPWEGLSCGTNPTRLAST
jgi:hypothetical protein